MSFTAVSEYWDSNWFYRLKIQRHLTVRVTIYIGKFLPLTLISQLLHECIDSAVGWPRTKARSDPSLGLLIITINVLFIINVRIVVLISDPE
jgi:hypothetical protein